ESGAVDDEEARRPDRDAGPERSRLGGAEDDALLRRSADVLRRGADDEDDEAVQEDEERELEDEQRLVGREGGDRHDGGTERANEISVEPRVIRSPSSSCFRSTRFPLTIVPFMEPRSTIT